MNDNQTIEVQPQQKQRNPIQLSESGVVKASTFDEQWRIATAYLESGLFPQALNTAAKILVSMQLLNELGLPVVSNVGKVCVINGTPSLFGDLPLSLVMRSGLLTSMKEEIEEKNGEPFLGRCTVKRKGFDDEVVRVFTLDDAKKAGLLDKNRSVWKIYPKRMLQMRARSWALKDLFPDVLNGVSIAEYDYDVIPDNNQSEIKTVVNVTPAEKLKGAFQDEQD